MLLDKVPKQEKKKKKKGKNRAYTHSTPVSAYMTTGRTPLTGMENNVYNNEQ